MSEAIIETPTDTPASRDDADTWVRDRARRVVSAHLTTREDADFARSVKSMIEKTVHEYDGRFLFELIQNGYDRQDPEKSSGLLAITLVDDELDHGVLYVANTGQGFTPSNVRAIANLGLSDKDVGEGIGNKGVGFKSVLQICESPEIYSTLPDGSPGFCFRFAQPEDIPSLVDEDPTRVQQVLDEMSLYSITVPAEGLPARVTAFWEQGYSSVVRLPLGGDAGELVVERLQELTRSTSPVLLFLRRLKQVIIRHESDGQCAEKVLTREPEVAPDLPADLPFDAPDASVGRYYTYLPLGAKAPSPFAGHLNAPFSTNLARTDVDTSNPLNRLLLGAAAALCLAAAEALTGWGEGPAGSVLDIISWDSERVSVLAEEAATQGLPLTKRALIPSRQPGLWTSMENTRRWPYLGTRILTATSASSACHVDFLPEIAPRRAERFDTMLAALGLSADPPPEQLASWVETMLDALLRAKRPISEWDWAYADIAVIFARNPAILGSRRILLTDDWELRLCAGGGRTPDAVTSKEATPFFPPVRYRVEEEEDDVDPDADLDLPKSLSRRLFYLNSGLTWYTNRQQTPARNFLQSNRLVRRFDTRSTFDHIRGLLSDSRSQAVARDALRFAFNLNRSGASTNVNLGELGLRVPTPNGKWIPASDAMFSLGWPDTSGDDLSLIAATPTERSEELGLLASRLLTPPTHFLGSKDDLRVWVDFLRRIGVSDLLTLNQLREGRSTYGRGLTSRWLSDHPDLPEPIRLQWAERLPSQSAAYYPETAYKAMSPVYWMPGQSDWESLTDNVRLAMCRQILRGLKEWDDDVFQMSWDRDRPGDKNRQSVSTPFQVFLRTAQWLPMQQPGTSLEDFVTPSQCWTFPIRGDETPPRYAALLSKRLRDLLDDEPMAIRRLRRLGLGVWGAAEDSRGWSGTWENWSHTARYRTPTSRSSATCTSERGPSASSVLLRNRIRLTRPPISCWTLAAPPLRWSSPRRMTRKSHRTWWLPRPTTSEA